MEVVLAISFISILVAYLSNNIYKKQLLIYQIIMFVASLVIGLLAQLILFVATFNHLWSIFSLVVWSYILVNAKKYPYDNTE